MKLHRLISSLLLALAAAGCHRAVKPEPAPEPKVTGDKIIFPAGAPQLASLTIAPVQSCAPADVLLFGRLTWNDDMTVRVFTPFGGRIRKTYAQAGDVLEKNAPLADVESSDFGQAQADSRKADSDWQLARRNLARQRELLAHGAAAQKDVEAAEADEARASSEQARALARLTVYGANADQVDGIFTLKTPIAGTVVEKNVNPGQEIRPDQMLANMPQFTAPLFVVSDPSRLWIQIDAAEADLPRLRPGGEFSFTARAFAGRTFTGRVEAVSESVDPNTRTIKVRGRVDNPHNLLKAEMFVNVNLPDEGTPAASVPSGAIFLKGEKHFVFVEEQPGQFARQEVQVGSEQAGRIAVMAGLAAGQRVVADGCILLQQMLE